MACMLGLASPCAHASTAPPVLLSSPSISGSPVVGKKLTVSNGSWANSPVSFKYEWFVCAPSVGCSVVSGAITNKIIVNPTFTGDTLFAEIAAINASGSTGPVASATTAAVQRRQQAINSIRLTRSMNPAPLHTTVVFTASVSVEATGGTLAFYVNQQSIPGCPSVSITAPSSRVTCRTSFPLPGSWTITAGYSYPYYGLTPILQPLQTSIAETVIRGARVLPKPPEKQVGTAGPKGRPNVRLTVLAVRSTRMPHLFWFALRGVRCVNHTTAVLVTIGRRTVRDKCGARVELASGPLAVHRYYRLTLRSVRYKGDRIVAHGPSYRERLYMPGDEVHWPAITGIKLLVSGAVT